MNAADSENFAQHEPSKRCRQSRADINGQKLRAGAYGAPDAAVKGPGGAINRHGKGIHVGIVNIAVAGIRPLVAKIGHGKQDADITQRDKQDGFGGQHKDSLPGPGPTEFQPPDREALWCAGF